MRISMVAGILGTVLLTGCASSRYARCPGDDSRADVETRLAARLDTGLAAGTGSLVVRVFEGWPDGKRLDNASVSLHTRRPAEYSSQHEIRRGLTHAAGPVVWDSLGPGRYVIRALRIASAPLQHRVQVRAGYRDTIDLRLQRYEICPD
jgi:hypothetical protein